MKKTIIIFANSVKHHQHCVAGKDVNTKQWIRPVGDLNGKELDNSQCTYMNPYGEFLVKPLQKIEVSLSQHAPLPHQPENYVISDKKWNQKYKIEFSEIDSFLDNPESLWGIGNKVDYSNILNNPIAIPQSLYLVKVENLNIYVSDDEKRRASFSFKGNNYDLPVTDPNSHKLLEKEMNHNSILCVSLGEEFQGSCYKIVATIF